METHILVVDDEKVITDLIEVYLLNENYIVHKFYNGADALACIQNTRLDLAVLDVMLPDLDGFALCRQIRELHHYPVIMLTAKGEDMDKITGLTIGADDYMTKPFNPLELVARIKAQLRRASRYNEAVPAPAEVLDFAGLVMNRRTHECFYQEKPLTLTPIEFSILWLLAENRGNVISSEQLFEEVWGEKYYRNSNNTVMVHIRHLREKMSEAPNNPKFIKTVWGVGYKIEK